MRPLRLLSGALLVGVVSAHTGETAIQPREPEPQEEPVLGTAADLAGSIEEDFLWLQAGEQIRRSPSLAAAAVATVDVRVEVPILERRDGWALVRYGSFKGWVRPDTSGEPVAETPLAPPRPDPEQLARARGLLQRDARAGKLGSFALHTDARNRRLLRILDQIAARLPQAYSSRYGLDPGTEAGEAVVIFSREKDYRAYVGTLSDADTWPHGHTRRGLAVLFVGKQSRDEVGAILVHELTHLLNRRVLKTLPHPWLEEGMGNDLAFCKIDEGSGELELGSLGGRSVVIEHPRYFIGGESRTDREVHLEGPVASLSLLQQRLERTPAPPLERLVTLPWEEFTETLELRQRYDRSAFFLRYLLDSGDGDLAAGLRAYLSSLAAGEAAGPAALQSHLQRSWEELERGFQGWIRRQRVFE